MNENTISKVVQVFAISFSFFMIISVIVGIVTLGVFLGKKVGGKADKMTRFLCLLPTVAAILISAAGFVLNMGWYRFGMIFAFVPVWYTLLLIVSSYTSASAIKKSPLIKATYAVSHVLYVASGLVMPDGGDDGPSYVFFGQITDYPNGLEYIAIALFVVSIASMIVQLVISRKLSKAVQETE